MMLLFLASILAGAVNSIAGGGSFISFPALLMVGIPSVHANATSNVALIPGLIASAIGYHEFLTKETLFRHLSFSIASILGSIVGALLLLYTPPSSFMQLVPWLLAIATLIFAFSESILKALVSKKLHLSPKTALTIQALASIYGGYFGAGVGIVMLSVFSLLGLKNIHLMNGLKNILAILINAAATVLFIAGDLIVWHEVSIMMLGSIIGGYCGAKGAQKVNQNYIRGMIIATGTLLTFYFFWKAL